MKLPERLPPFIVEVKSTINEAETTVTLEAMVVVAIDGYAVTNIATQDFSVSSKTPILIQTWLDGLFV